MMMPSPEYERVSALSKENYEKWRESLGLYGYSGEKKDYRYRINLERKLAYEGKGPGAWFERFIHECGKENGRRR